jgi:hypothetical protein
MDDGLSGLKGGAREKKRAKSKEMSKEQKKGDEEGNEDHEKAGIGAARVVCTLQHFIARSHMRNLAHPGDCAS